MSLSAFINQVNNWGKEAIPFFFVIDFELEQPKSWPLTTLSQEGIYFDFEGLSNHAETAMPPVFIEKIPLSFEDYKARFDRVHRHLQLGNSFLANLTTKTQLVTRSSLKDIFAASQAKYKLLYKDEWMVFSPETFVRIENGRIETCPMKGTIDASFPDAANVLLNDAKELAEHVTVVDLLRNDLSRVSTNVTVEQFRYVEKISTSSKDLLQTSTRILGQLPLGYEQQLGQLLVDLLPAGSVSGAPKPMTCSIIREAEGEKRGYYTGVAGYYDGSRLNSCVLIRFIERVGDQLFYRSGGGITAQSQADLEYKELIDKVYVPAAGVYQNS